MRKQLLLLIILLSSTNLFGKTYIHQPQGKEMPFQVDIRDDYKAMADFKEDYAEYTFIKAPFIIKVYSYNNSLDYNLEKIINQRLTHFVVASRYIQNPTLKRSRMAPYPMHLEFLYRESDKTFRNLEGFLSFFNGRRIVRVACNGPVDQWKSFETACLNAIMSLQSCGEYGSKFENIEAVSPRCISGFDKWALPTTK